MTAQIRWFEKGALGIGGGDEAGCRKTGGRLGETCAVLLAPVCRRASDAPRVRGDIAADLGVAFACGVAIDFWREPGEEGGREDKVYVQPAGKASSGFRSMRKGQNDCL
jgi:hypothetical protein